MDRATASGLLLRRTDYAAFGVDPKPLTKRVQSGDLHTVAAGVYVASDEWRELRPREQHLLRIFAQRGRVRDDVVLSHHSAAALHGISLLGPMPEKISVGIPPTSGGRSSGDVRRRHLRLADEDVVTVDGIRVTSAARTVIDLARELNFAEGVAMVDSARNHRRPLVTLDELRDQLNAQTRCMGVKRAEAVVAFSTNLSDSVEESRARVLIHQLGFPAPELQHPIMTPLGTYYADFWWEEFEHWGEFDGTQKYTDTRMLAGRRAEDVVVAEKRREDEIRRHVRAFSRWGTAENRNPLRLREILMANGLPSSGIRPLPF